MNLRTFSVLYCRIFFALILIMAAHKIGYDSGRRQAMHDLPNSLIQNHTYCPDDKQRWYNNPDVEIERLDRRRADSGGSKRRMPSRVPKQGNGIYGGDMEFKAADLPMHPTLSVRGNPESTDSVNLN